VKDAYGDHPNKHLGWRCAMIKFKKVTVLGVPYTVHIIPQQKIQEIIGVDAVGFCDDLEERIVLSQELKGRALKKIFVHEWVHAVAGVNGLNQTLDPVVAEAFSQSFANALIEMLDQPEVRAFLLKANTK
jgi:hypothetical protein